jgi:hypothetical protein
MPNGSTGTGTEGIGFNADQALGFGTAAVGAITAGIGAGMQAQARIDAINKANRMGREQNVAIAKYRAANMFPRSGNMYGTYQYGGSVMGYGENMDTEATERAGQRAITEGTTESIVSAIPVVGQIIGAATGVVKGVQSAAGKQRVEVDGKMIDAYPDETAAGVGNAMKMFTPHQSAFDHAENKDYGRAVLSWTGLGIIPDMIEGMSDQQDYESQQARLARQNRRTQGGTTGGSHLNNQELAMNAMQERQIPTAKYGGAMDMMDYGKGGLYANIHAKRERIKAGSGETMRSPGDSGAPTAQAFRDSAETAKMGMGGMMEYGKGGYTVTRSDDRKGKTHKVTGPDGSVKYFGNPNMGERSESKHGKEAFYARHKSNLEGNPHFRAYARATWENGGIYIDPAKKGTFKAQATRMDMGVQEAASKILNAPEGEYSPEMRRKANFARNFAKRDGGMMEYKAGGMHYSDGVQIKNANAELEGDEIIMKNGGKRDVKVNGPTHEQGGVPMKLEKGDYVWSDHLKDPQSGMSMAQLYEKLSKNGASDSEINQLMQYQEALAGRAGGQGMDQTAKKGGLMKYQNGTPSLSPFIQNPNMTPGQMDAYVKLMNKNRAAQPPAPPAPKKPKAPASPPPAPPATPSGLEGYFHHLDKDYNMGRLEEAKVNRAGYDNPETRPPATPPSTRPDYLKYAPEMISGLGSLAGIIATATQDFDKVPVPQAARVKAEKMFLDRISPDAEIARSQQDFRAMLDAILRGGQGPGASSTIQEAYSAKVRADEQARADADRLNIQVDATEKAGNIDSRLQADMFNEENAARYREMAFAQDAASKTFERERTQAIVNQILQGTQAVADTAMNRRYAEAISGDTGALERFKRTGLQADLDKFLASLNKK